MSRMFDDRIAMSEAYQYDGTKNGDSWKRKVKSYWISKCPDALPLLD